MKTLLLKQLVPDPNQPRQEFDPKEMKKLENSIKAKGILVPIAVEKLSNGKYLVLDGERRMRAATSLKLEQVPVIIYDEMSEIERIGIRFHLQEQHAGWTAFDKARAISIMKSATGMSNSEMADLLGMYPKTVSDYMAILSLSKRTANFVNDKKLTFKIIIKLAYLKKVVGKKKDEIEEAIVKKIESGVINSSEDIQKYINSIKFLDDEVQQNKIISKIIEDPDFDAKDVVKQSGIGDLRNQQKIKNYCSILRSWIKQELKLNKKIYIRDKDKTSLENTIKLLNKYLEETIAD